MTILFNIDDSDGDGRRCQWVDPPRVVFGGRSKTQLWIVPEDYVEDSVNNKFPYSLT